MLHAYAPVADEALHQARPRARVTTEQNRVTGRETVIDRGLRLAQREALQRQLTALETAMTQMSFQSSWLASQLSSLPKSS